MLRARKEMNTDTTTLVARNLDFVGRACVACVNTEWRDVTDDMFKCSAGANVQHGHPEIWLGNTTRQIAQCNLLCALRQSPSKLTVVIDGTHVDQTDDACVRNYLKCALREMEEVVLSVHMRTEDAEYQQRLFDKLATLVRYVGGTAALERWRTLRCIRLHLTDASCKEDEEDLNNLEAYTIDDWQSITQYIPACQQVLAVLSTMSIRPINFEMVANCVSAAAVGDMVEDMRSERVQSLVQRIIEFTRSGVESLHLALTETGSATADDYVEVKVQYGDIRHLSHISMYMHKDTIETLEGEAARDKQRRLQIRPIDA